MAIIAHTTSNAGKDRFATGGSNQWLPVDLSAGELAAWIIDRDYTRRDESPAMTVENTQESSKLEVKVEENPPGKRREQWNAG